MSRKRSDAACVETQDEAGVTLDADTPALQGLDAAVAATVLCQQLLQEHVGVGGLLPGGYEAE